MAWLLRRFTELLRLVLHFRHDYEPFDLLSYQEIDPSLDLRCFPELKCLRLLTNGVNYFPRNYHVPLSDAETVSPQTLVTGLIFVSPASKLVIHLDECFVSHFTAFSTLFVADLFVDAAKIAAASSLVGMVWRKCSEFMRSTARRSINFSTLSLLILSPTTF